MLIHSDGIVNGVIEERFGKRGTQFSDEGTSSRSLPFHIQDAPAGTVCFALVLEDKDAIPVCGYSWIHWTATNLTSPGLAENASREQPGLLQGTTSWSGKISGKDRMAVSFYGGMAPPDKPHIYQLHVFALDKLMDLQPGFYANELYWAMQGHILDCATLSGSYANEANQ